MECIRSYEAGLARKLRDGLASVNGLCIRGIVEEAKMRQRVPTFSFTLAGRHPREVCESLDAAGIAAWDGHYYAVEVTRRLGLDEAGGMVRVGAAHYTTASEVDRLVEAIGDIARGAPVTPRP
jgi:selenocysteine lyase/cysteine desulfurase